MLKSLKIWIKQRNRLWWKQMIFQHWFLSVRSLGPRGTRAHLYKDCRWGENKCTECRKINSLNVSFLLFTSLTAVVLKRLARCSIIDIESAWKVFTGDFSILLTVLIDDFSKRGQNWTRWTFIYHSAPKKLHCERIYDTSISPEIIRRSDEHLLTATPAHLGR